MPKFDTSFNFGADVLSNPTAKAPKRVKRPKGTSSKSRRYFSTRASGPFPARAGGARSGSAEAPSRARPAARERCRRMAGEIGRAHV